jgi:hypothetical protein
MPVLTLPSSYLTLIQALAPVVSKRIWQHVQILVLGILAPGRRSVTTVLCIMGLSQDRDFQNYYRVLNRATWSSLEISRILLGLLLTTCALTGTVLMRIDETIERRWGANI